MYKKYRLWSWYMNVYLKGNVFSLEDNFYLVFLVFSMLFYVHIIILSTVKFALLFILFIV